MNPRMVPILSKSTYSKNNYINYLTKIQPNATGKQTNESAAPIFIASHAIKKHPKVSSKHINSHDMCTESKCDSSKCAYGENRGSYFFHHSNGGFCLRLVVNSARARATTEIAASRRGGRFNAQPIETEGLGSKTRICVYKGKNTRRIAAQRTILDGGSLSSLFPAKSKTNLGQGGKI